MSQRRVSGLRRTEQGIALPVALIALAILASLMVAFAVLSGSEPVIASNHSLSAQARAIAESGLERAIWALSAGVPAAVALPAQAPYDGAQFLALSTLGGYTVRIAPATLANEREVEATGWAPAQGPTAAVKRIRAVVMKLLLKDPPCGICSKGELEVSGNAKIDATQGGCPGMTPRAGTMTLGQTSLKGSGEVYGPGDKKPNQEPADILDNDPGQPPRVTAADFDFLLGPGQLAALKDLAKKNGTYYRGAVLFNNSNPMPNGIVYVDTTTGADFTESTPDSEAASVVIDGNITWRGWLIVQGRLDIRGTVDLTGLVYALNEIILTGNGQISGAVVSENRKDTVASVISTATGSTNVEYSCQAIRDGGDTVPEGWFVKPGSYREVAGR